MNFKTTYVLFGVLLVMLGLFGLVLMTTPEKPVDTSLSLLPSVHDPKDPVEAKDITVVEIDRIRPIGEKTEKESAAKDKDKSKEKTEPFVAQKLVFERQSDKDPWKMTGPAAYRVNTFMVNTIVNQLLDARRDPKADMSKDLALYELDNPAAIVTLKKGDERSWTVNIGKEGIGGASANVYVTSSDHKEPMAVRKSEINSVFNPVNDFRDKNLLADNDRDIQSLTVQDSKNGVALKKASESRWRFEKPADFGEADYSGDTSTPPVPNAPPAANVSSLLQAIAALKVGSNDDFVADNASDLAKYGLEDNKAERLKIEVKHNVSGLGGDKKEPVTAVLLVGKKVEDKDKKPDDKTEKVYARLADEKHVVRIDAKNLELVQKLLDNPTAYRDRDLAHVDEMRTDAVDIKLAAGPAIELRRPTAGEWKLFVEGSKPYKADTGSVQSLITALNTKHSVKDWPDPKSKDADLGLDKPQAVVTVWEDAIPPPDKPKEEDKTKKDGDKKESEKKADDKKEGDKKPEEKKDPDAKPVLKADKKDKPAIKLTFGKKDVNKGVVYVRRQVEDETILLAVQDSVLPTVTREAIAYRDRALPIYSEPAEKLTLIRSDGAYELEKEKKDNKETWKVKLPKELAGRTGNASNIESAIGNLRFMQAQQLVAEKPSDADLDQKYGLKNPSTKAVITVTKDKKPEDHVYLFGKDTPTGEVYAKVSGTDLIFTVAKMVVTSLNADLLDPTVFTFEQSKVKGLKLTGWQDVAGTAVTIDLERKGPLDWVVKSPKDFNLDPAKAEDLISKFTNFRADEMIPAKNAPKPEVFDMKAGTLEVLITVDGEKEPISVSIGTLDANKKFYYAKSNKLLGQFFFVKKELFETTKSKPAALSK